MRRLSRGKPSRDLRILTEGKIGEAIDFAARYAMPVLPEGGDLLSFVPRITKGVARVIKINAVVADTLIASLEMARERAASIEQDFDFERILVVTAGFTAGVSEI